MQAREKDIKVVPGERGMYVLHMYVSRLWFQTKEEWELDDVKDYLTDQGYAPLPLTDLDGWQGEIYFRLKKPGWETCLLWVQADYSEKYKPRTISLAHWTDKLKLIQWLDTQADEVDMVEDAEPYEWVRHKVLEYSPFPEY